MIVNETLFIVTD